MKDIFFSVGISLQEFFALEISLQDIFSRNYPMVYYPWLPISPLKSQMVGP